jgi:hypothetical protein
LRHRTIVSDVLFTLSAAAGLIGVHKYVFGDFPKLWFVRHLPWHAVNPWIASALCLVLAWIAAQVARGTGQDLTTPVATSATAPAELAAGDPLRARQPPPAHAAPASAAPAQSFKRPPEP